MYKVHVTMLAKALGLKEVCCVCVSVVCLFFIRVVKNRFCFYDQIVFTLIKSLFKTDTNPV